MTESALTQYPAKGSAPETRFFFEELRLLTRTFETQQHGEEQKAELKEHPVLKSLRGFVAGLAHNATALADLRHCKSVEDIAATAVFWELIARLSLPPLPEKKELRDDYRYLALALWCLTFSSLRSEMTVLQELSAEAQDADRDPCSFLCDLGALRADAGYRISDERFNALLTAPSPEIFIRLVTAFLNMASFRRDPLSVLYVITLWCRDYVHPMNDMTQRPARFRLAQRFFHHRYSD